MKKLTEEILNAVSINLREKIINIQKNDLNIEEIRLRTQKPLIVSFNNKDYFYNNSRRCLENKNTDPYIVTREDIDTTFQLM